MQKSVAMLPPMRDPNQTPPFVAPQEPESPATPAAESEARDAATPAPFAAEPVVRDAVTPACDAEPPLLEAAPLAAAPPSGLSLNRALIFWLALLIVFGVGGLILGQQELALLAAFAGIFVAAHAADVDRGWRELYWALGWIVPALGFIAAIAIGGAIWQSDLPGLVRGALVLLASVGAGLAVLSVPSMVADRFARALFREPRPGHLLRVTARCVVLTFALAIPGWFAAQQVMESLLDEPGALMDPASLSGGLIGYVLVAFAGVGCLIRRDLAESARRLGLRLPGWRDGVFALGALAALWALNQGADVVQQRWFPALWAADQRVTAAIASGLGVGRAVMLGLSAGIGEEITLRGGLQPRLGIVLTAAFFAALHVQYSWFGMLVIFVLGMLLGFVRKRASTTAAILAHVAYDVIAVLGN